MPLFDRPQQARVFRWVVLALLSAAALTFHSLWAPLVLAAWIAAMARPLVDTVAKATRGRRGAAGVLVVALVMLMLVPLAMIIVSLSSGASELVRSVMQSQGAKDALVTIAVGGEHGLPPPGGGAELLDTFESPQRFVTLVQDHGAQALDVTREIVGAASTAVLGLFVFVYAVYVFLVDGPEIYEWFERHSPLSAEQTRRFTAAFHETGRGLLVGLGLTGLAQGVVATIAYVALGVPRALVLGLLTFVTSLVPSVGTGLVWVPVAAGLFLAGKTASAAIMVVVGIAVISTIDNFLRPLFSRVGKLELPTFVLLASIFGGLATFGAGGLLLGPLIARLAKEALLLARDERSAVPD